MTNPIDVHHLKEITCHFFSFQCAMSRACRAGTALLPIYVIHELKTEADRTWEAGEEPWTVLTA